MGSELVRQTQHSHPFALIEALDNLQDSRFIKSLVETGFYSDKGDSYQQTLNKLILRIGWGAELGMSPMWSLKNVFMVKGTATIGAAGVGHLILRSGFVRYQVLETNARLCRIEFFRHGNTVGVSQWTIEEAKKAGLFRNPVWNNYAEDMLRSRALTRGARAYCPDVTGGPIYTPEELRSTVVDVQQDGSYTVQEPQPEPSQAEKPQERTRAQERIRARNDLLALVKAHTHSQKAQLRVFRAIAVKLDKPKGDETAEDFASMAGIVRAYAEQGKLEDWCDLIIGDIAEGEVVEPETVNETTPDPYWKGANAKLHAIWGSFAKRLDVSASDSPELRIMHDMVRSWSNLDPGEDWSGTTVTALNEMSESLEEADGTVARIALETNWLDAAEARGVEF